MKKEFSGLLRACDTYHMLRGENNGKRRLICRCRSTGNDQQERTMASDLSNDSDGPAAWKPDAGLATGGDSS